MDLGEGPTTAIASPDSHLAVSSGFPTVAERPIRWKPFGQYSLILSRATNNCAPLSDDARSCTSSNTTAFIPDKCPLSLLPRSIICAVSGVVISRFGGFFDCFVLSLCEVSPCLSPTVIPKGSSISASLLSISLFSALRGVM